MRAVFPNRWLFSGVLSGILTAAGSGACGEYPHDFVGDRLTVTEQIAAVRNVTDALAERPQEELEALAEQKNPVALAVLGARLMRNGSSPQETAQNLKGGMARLEEAGEAGFLPALFLLGTLHETGLKRLEWPEDGGSPVEKETLPCSFARAAACYEKAAEEGFAPARWRLGLLLLNGLGVEKDEAKARALMRLAALAGHEPAYLWLMTEDRKKQLDPLAERGDAPALLARGKLLMNEWLTREEEKETKAAAREEPAFWSDLRKAAEKGEPEARFLIACGRLGFFAAARVDSEEILKTVSEHMKKEPEIQKMLRTSAEKGFSPAQILLGLVQLKGLDAENGPESGFQWLLKAAEAGNLTAQAIVTDALILGIGTKPDAARALKIAQKEEPALNEKALLEAFLRNVLSRDGFKSAQTQFPARLLPLIPKIFEQKAAFPVHLPHLLLTRNPSPTQDALAFRLLSARLSPSGSGQPETSPPREEEEEDAAAWILWPTLLSLCHSEGWGTPKNAQLAQAWQAEAEKRLQAEGLNPEEWAELLPQAMLPFIQSLRKGENLQKTVFPNDPLPWVTLTSDGSGRPWIQRSNEVHALEISERP